MEKEDVLMPTCAHCATHSAMGDSCLTRTLGDHAGDPHDEAQSPLLSETHCDTHGGRSAAHMAAYCNVNDGFGQYLPFSEAQRQRKNCSTDWACGAVVVWVGATALHLSDSNLLSQDPPLE